MRVASNGNMRETPSSVAFSTSHSKRSNLIRAVTREMWIAGAGEASFSRTRKETTDLRATSISGEIEVAVIREFVELADLGAEDADKVLGVGASELGRTAADLRDEEAASGHRIGLFYGTNPSLPNELELLRDEPTLVDDA